MEMNNDGGVYQEVPDDDVFARWVDDLWLFGMLSDVDASPTLRLGLRPYIKLDRRIGKICHRHLILLLMEVVVW